MKIKSINIGVLACMALMLLISTDLIAQRKIKQMDPQKEQLQKDAEASEEVPLSERLTYGGNFWITFSNLYSQVYLQPLIGYKVNNDFIAGAGLTYIYWSQDFTYSSGGGTYKTSISDNIFGLNFFGRHRIIDPIFAHVEYQPMNFTSYNLYLENKRIWTNALYLGGGINQSIGSSGSGAYFMVLYDVLWQDRSPDPKSFSKSFYMSPWSIRAGFLF